LGLIHARLGQHTLAAAAYREAMDDSPPAEGYMLALGLGNSLYEIGELAEAERVYRGAIDDERVNVKACANLARLIIRRGGDLEEAEGYLKLAVQAANGGVHRCELAELLSKRGKLEEARQELAKAEQELANSQQDDERKALAQARSTIAPTPFRD
jgi:Flp pilus assembly protein TadD